MRSKLREPLQSLVSRCPGSVWIASTFASSFLTFPCLAVFLTHCSSRKRQLRKAQKALGYCHLVRSKVQEEAKKRATQKQPSYTDLCKWTHTPPAPGHPPPEESPGPGYLEAQPPYSSSQDAPGPDFQEAPVCGAPPLQGQLDPPMGAVWMPAPPPPPNCPPGLEYLSQIDQVLIEQQPFGLEGIASSPTKNMYEIKNALGQRLYVVCEYNYCCMLNFCRVSRPFDMEILDQSEQPVMQLSSPQRCTSCCCPGYLQELEVHAPPGTPFGYVKQFWHPCLPKFSVQNEAREDVLKVVGPWRTCRWRADVDFEVKSTDEKSSVGRISRLWPGFAREDALYTNSFEIRFPRDLDVKTKAVMLGACFLIDFMFFEFKQNTFL